MAETSCVLISRDCFDLLESMLGLLDMLSAGRDSRKVATVKSSSVSLCVQEINIPTNDVFNVEERIKLTPQT